MTLSATLLKQYLTNLIKDSVVRLTVLVLGLHEDAGRREFGLAFSSGQDVKFGAVVLSREGINLADCIIPWSALRSFRVSKREVIFVRQFGNRFESCKVPASKVRNLSEMLYLVEAQMSAKQHQLTH
jgi:hypothetical protein